MKVVQRLAVTLFVAFSFTATFAQNKTASSPKLEVYRQALDLFKKEKYASAQFLFDRFVEDQPLFGSNDVADAYYYSAVCAEELNNDDALYRLEEFARLFPQSARLNMTHFYMGNFHYTRGQYSDALREFNQVEPSEVDFGHRNEYDFKMGYSYFVNGQNDKAKAAFARVINSKSKFKIPATYYYAHIQYEDKEYELALKNFKKIEGDRNFSKFVPSYEARIYYYLGREDELLEMAPRLLQQADVFKKSELQQMVGEVYFNRGEYSEALKYYKATEVSLAEEARSSKNKGANSEIDNNYQKGFCYYQLGAYDSAAACLSRKANDNDSIAQNALYTLGDTYIHLNKKSQARSMFLQASQMNFDAKIKEDALFNYAKLSCELNTNPYNESIHSFEDYLKKYPKTSRKAEIQEILTSLYMTTRNYKDALALIENIPNKSAAMNQAYQRIVLNRGIELFNSRNMQQSASYFKKAIDINAMPKITCDAYYLYGESKYRLDDFTNADKAFDKFFLNSNASKSAYYLQALYTYGYLCMKKERYSSAAGNFSKFIQKADNTVERSQVNDAHNRLGDCLYVQKKFDDAIAQYDIVINNNGKDADYATYQKALSYGALGKNQDKLTYLNYIFERYKNSPLSSKATLEVANTYLVCDNNEMALMYYDKFIKQYPQSAFVKDALLNMGLIYYNTERDDKALEVFNRLLTQYQGTEEARDALPTVKNIYVSQNRVNDYFDYVENTAKMTISKGDQDSTTFSAAEECYFRGDCDKAIAGFDNYLKKFPRGLFYLQSRYYMADCLNKLNQYEKALEQYEIIASKGTNQFTVPSLKNAATIAFTLKDYQKSLEHYVMLVNLAEDDNTRLKAREGVLECHTLLGNHSNVITAANSLLKESKISEEQRDGAIISIARTFYQQNNNDSAEFYYTKLIHSNFSDYNGEANYRCAEILFRRNQLGAAEAAIESIAANPANDYWLAKAFILWADIFTAQGNTIQAKQTLQSIIDNFDGEDLVSEALQKRNKILADEESAKHKANNENDEVIIDY